MRHSSRQVLVDDVNDNNPEFTQSTYESTVEENTYDGQHLLNVSATDADVGENARLTYAIASSDVIDLVDVDEHTGRIVVRRSLDYEAVKKVSGPTPVRVRETSIPASLIVVVVFRSSLRWWHTTTARLGARLPLPSL